MPTVPVIPTQVQDPARQAQFSAPGVVPVQPQQPGQLQRIGQQMERAGQQWDALDADRARYANREAEKAAAKAEKEALDAKNRIDIASHTERWSAAQESEIAKFSDFVKLEGKAAVDSLDQYMQGVDDRLEARVNASPEGPQRDWMRDDSRKERVRLFRAAVAHRDKELRTWRVGGAAASASQKEATAIRMLDAEDRQSYINEAIAATMESAEVQGLSDDERNLMVRSSLARIHGESLRTLVQNNRTGEAAAYLDKHRLDLDPAQRGDFEALVRRGVVRDVAYTLAAATMQEAGGDEFKALERLEQERQAGKIDADTTAAAEARVRMLANDARSKRAEQTADVLTEGEAHILGGGMLSDRPDIYEAARKSGVLPQLLRLEQSRKTDTNPVALAEALSLPDEALAKVTRQELVVRYWGQLSRVDLNSVLERRDSAARRIQDGTSGSANVLDQDDLIKREFMRYRAPEASTFERAVIGQERQFQAFRSNLQEQVDAERKAGKPVTKQRIRELAETVGADMVYLEAGGAPMPRLMLTDAEEMEAGASTASGRFVKLGSIEPAVAAEIARVLRSRGFNADFATVANEWEKIGMPKSITEIKRREPK